MRSIHHHTPPPLSTLSNQLNCFSTHSLHTHLPNHVRTKPMAVASSHLVVLAVNSTATTAATTGNLSVLIPTSAAFIFLYWIANFVVPEIIMKDLQSEDADKDQKPNE